METPVTRILVVDNDREWFAKCEKAVSDVGFDVRLAMGGCDAYAAIKERVPDLVFVGMESGSENRQILWLLEDLLPDVPVVVCSAGGDLSGSLAAIIQGDVAAFLHKFADPAEIVGTTARVLGQSRGFFDRGDAFDSVLH